MKNYSPATVTSRSSTAHGTTRLLLAQLIYAQNFSMPAGYVADKSGESWLLKVGEEYDSVSATPMLWSSTHP